MANVPGNGSQESSPAGGPDERPSIPDSEWADGVERWPGATAHKQLLEYYGQCLQSLDDGKDSLWRELQTENEYQQAVLKIVREAGFKDSTPAYSGWDAFSGGAENVVTMLETVSAEVYQSAKKAGLVVPPILCALWPDSSLNARSILRPYGGLVLVNSGLLAAIRIFIQYVAQSLDRILGTTLSEHDPRSTSQVSAELSAMIDRYLHGVDVRVGSRVSVIRGWREDFRRKANYAAIGYVVGHEVGHLSRNRPGRGGWSDDNQDFQRGMNALSIADLLMPRSEQDAVATHTAEAFADHNSFRILRNPPLGGDSDLGFAQVVGPMSVLALLAGVWWKQAAHTDADLDWVHPYPESRMWNVKELLAAPPSKVKELAAESPRREILDAPPTELEDASRRFAEWATDVLTIPALKLTAKQRGLTNRGINPLSLMMFYMAEGIPEQRSQ
jgi:hypothetical protein